MKQIMIFRGGQPGCVVDAEGMDLADLLGGEVEWTDLGGGTLLAARADGEEKQIPIRYALHRKDVSVAPIPGDCAIVGKGEKMSVFDIQEARAYVRAIDRRG